MTKMSNNVVGICSAAEGEHLRGFIFSNINYGREPVVTGESLKRMPRCHFLPLSQKQRRHVFLFGHLKEFVWLMSCITQSQQSLVARSYEGSQGFWIRTLIQRTELRLDTGEVVKFHHVYQKAVIKNFTFELQWSENSL